MRNAKLSKAELLLQLNCLRHRLADFEREKQDLQISLEIITEHADSVEQEFLTRLKSFCRALHVLKQEKTDLEIALETVTDHGDMFEHELVTERSILEQEVAKRTEELAGKNRLLELEIQERQRAEEQLRLAASVFETSREGILITDAQTRIVRVNQAFVRQTGYAAADCLGLTPQILKSGRHGKVFFQNMWAALQEAGHWSGEIWNRRQNEQTYCCWLSISVVKNDLGEVTHYVGILADNTEKKLSEEHIYRLGHYDALTGLPNRVLFQDRIQQALRRGQRDAHWVALLVIDLDYFKAINDTFGHPVGDQLLCMVAQRLGACLDNNQEAMARLGGDEFAILLDDLAPDQYALQAASGLAQKVSMCLAPAFILEGQEVYVSASIGIAFFPQDGWQVADLLRNADTAMYDAKSRGRNSFQFFAESMNTSAHKRLNLQSHLRRAVEHGELLLYYQPQVNARNGELAGVEALLRWEHPALGWVSPLEFVPVAEDCGLIASIGEWVLYTACAQNLAWREQGMGPLRMAVNLSARQFQQSEGLINNIAQTLERTGLPPEWLELEITESVAMQCAPKAVNTLYSLKNLGVRLAIDDFGTGYSSLNYLTQFTIDTLKIDASFVANLGSRNGAALVLAIINMAHSLRMQVVAEGVENEEQFEFLRRHQCDYVQGYLFSKPLPATEIDKFCQNRIWAVPPPKPELAVHAPR